MPAELYYLLSFLFGTILVVTLTPIVKRVGVTTGQVDQPNARKIHDAPIVRIGGISLFLATILTLILLYQLEVEALLAPQEVKNIISVTLGGCAFFVIGLVDDIWNVSPFKRLGLQFLTVGVFWWQGLSIDLGFLPWQNAFVINSLSFVITFLWLAGVANAVNWIDGMDGLAGGVAGITALGILFVTLDHGNKGVALLMAILAGSAIAFLWYNFHPATIFMGDCGSNFLGFMLAGASLVGMANEPGIGNTLAPFVFLAVPIGDMIVVINARLRQGLSPFSADQIHIHHRLLAKGLSQTTTALLIYSVTLWTATLGLICCGIEQPWIYFIPATILLLIMIWQVQANRKVEEKE